MRLNRSRFPISLAQVMAVFPKESFFLVLAPNFNRSLAISLFCFLTANIKGVSPSRFGGSTSLTIAICNKFQQVATSCNKLQQVATSCCNLLQLAATCKIALWNEILKLQRLLSSNFNCNVVTKYHPFGIHAPQGWPLNLKELVSYN